MKYIQLLVLMFMVFIPSLIAQDDGPITVSTNLVNVNVAIVDAKGNHVEGLLKENFRVFDNGAKQEISHFSSEDAPISFGIVYDMHPTTTERTTAVLESLRQFTKGLRKQDDFFTLVFNKRGSLLLDFVPTSERVRIHLAGKYGEPNALYDAMYQGIAKLREKRNLKRVLLVITDSADHNSEHRFNDVLGQFKTLDAQVYTILWDEQKWWNYTNINGNEMPEREVSSDASGLDHGAILELALRTGGGVRSPTVQSARELFEIYSEIGLELRKQYAIGFYPRTVDGKSHRLKIKLRSVKKSKKMVLTYRPGYQSRKIGK